MNFIYNTFLRRSSTYALTIIGGVFIFERVFDQGADYLFEYINRGVSTQYCIDDIRRFVSRIQLNRICSYN